MLKGLGVVALALAAIVGFLLSRTLRSGVVFSGRPARPIRRESNPVEYWVTTLILATAVGGSVAFAAWCLAS